MAHITFILHYTLIKLVTLFLSITLTCMGAFLNALIILRLRNYVQIFIFYWYIRKSLKTTTLQTIKNIIFKIKAHI